MFFHLYAIPMGTYLSEDKSGTHNSPASRTSVASNVTAEKVLSAIRFPDVPQNSCSTFTEGNLAGTAAHEPCWIALEQPGAWGRDIFDGVAFDSTVAQALEKKLADEGGYRLLLIRKPGRLGQVVQDGVRRVFLARRIHGQDQLFTFCVKGPADLLELPLNDPSQIPFAERLPGTVLTLVCAHAKRDQCCALRGRPIARFLAQMRLDGAVWECSHLGGHRLAPTAMLLPSGYTYGRISAESMLAATSCLEETGVPLVDNLRGRSSLPAAHQVAEVAVRELLLTEQIEPGIEELTFEDASQTYSDSAISSVRVKWESARGAETRAWDVVVKLEKTAAVPASCGKEAKPAKSYDVVEIRPL